MIIMGSRVQTRLLNSFRESRFCEECFISSFEKFWVLWRAESPATNSPRAETRQNTLWNLLNGYESESCAFIFKVNDDFWWKWISIFDIFDSYLSDWSRFHNIIQKEKLWNLTRIRFWDELAKSHGFRLVENTVNERYKIFDLSVIKTQFAALSGLGFRLPVK